MNPWRRRGDLAVALVSLVAFAATSPPLHTVKLEDHGGPRTAVYAGSKAELVLVLEACGIDWHPEDVRNGKIGIVVTPEPWNEGIYLAGRFHEDQARTALIFEEALTGYQQDEEATLVDRSISAIEACLDPPEIELPAAETRDATDLLNGLEGAFVVLSDGRTLVHNPERAETRFPPASSFKIPNMLIALETGVASGPDFPIGWDGRRPADGFWARSWSQDHTLRSAIRDGVLWYFQEIARRIGRERMTAYIRWFGYGNRDVSGPIDRFWLDGPLEISAREQVEFLRRVREGRLRLSERTIEIARDVLVLETSERYTLSGKTGSVPLPSGRLLAWLVGWVERAPAPPEGVQTALFALNLDCPSFESCDLMMRRRLALAILDDWGILLPAEQSQVFPVR